MKEPKLTVIDSLDGLLALQEYLKDESRIYVAYDCETTGLDKSETIVGFSVCAHEDEAFYVILQKWTGGKLEPQLYLQEARELILDLRKKDLIMHNSVFDCMIAESYFKVRLIDALHTDTMVLAHLLDENRKKALKDLARTLFGDDATKEQAEMKESVLKNGGIWTSDIKEMYKADPYILGKYGAKDAWLTYRLFHRLIPDLFEQGLEDFFYKDESMPLLKGPTYELNTTGLQINLDALQKLGKTLEAECAEAKAFILSEVTYKTKEKYPGTTKKNSFNISSPQQISWLMFSEYRLEFATLTKGGKALCKALDMKLPYTQGAKRAFIADIERRKGEKVMVRDSKTKKMKSHKIKAPWAYIDCGKKTLNKYSSKYKWIERLLEYKKKDKLLGTYVEGIKERTKYGIIQPSFNQSGTTSGRYSSRNPNFQNLPRDDKRIKSCVVARPGKVFVGADYSQLEPRVFAYFSGDERLKKCFASGDDFYSVIGIPVYGKLDCTPRKEGSPDAFGIKYKSLRDGAKVIALAATYGTTAYQLASTTGKTIDETQDVIDRYFEEFPKVKEFQLDSHKQVKSVGYVTSLFGRKRRIPDAKFIPRGLKHEDLPYEARNLLNLAVNYRVQSTGASIVNRASLLFKNNCNKLGIECRIVVQVHDSIVVECDKTESDTIAALLQNGMETAVSLEGVAMEAVPKIGTNLAEV